MLSTSPDHTSAASPPGAPSSQSSSVGSCYTSSSSQASVRARHTLSDPSSSSTSPASAFDRSSDYHTAPAPAKRPSNGAASAHTNQSFSALAAQQTGLASSAASAAMNPQSTAYEAMDPRAYLRAGPSSRAHPDAATPSPNEPRYPQSGSPDNSHAPAAKTRRTSPGGSRASGNLAPSHYDRTESPHPEYSAIPHAPRSSQLDTSADSSAFTSSNASTLHPSSSFAPMDWSSEAGTHASSRRAASPGDPRAIDSHMPSSKATAAPTSSLAASPRTRSDGQSHPAHQYTASSSGAQASASISSRASASSSADRAETKSHPTSMPKMDLATFPPQELLKILATLLQEIASANDDFQPDGSKDESSRSRRGARTRDRSTPATPAEASDSADTAAARDYAAPPGSHLSFSDSRRPSVTTAALGALATPSSTLCFHARNVPSISIESYLLRILKYCPTTNEVFLSLLVYFDRMSRMGTGAKPGANGGGEAAGEAAGLPRALERATGQADAASQPFATRGSDGEASSLDSKTEHAAAHPGIRGFAIDSYNVHRLVIAGVTVASKFFSDVFYTNSRYAKVGGLPPHELNQLELQFLLLNDFRLTIPLEEMQRYADQLLMYGSGRAELARSTKQANPAASLGSSRPSAATGEPVAGRPSTSAAENVEHDSAGATLQTAAQARPTEDAGVDTQGDVHMSDVKAS